MSIPCSVSIRAYNRYQPTTPGKMAATLQYARMYVFTAYINLALTVETCFNMSYIALSFRHCKHTTNLFTLYISLTSIINQARFSQNQYCLCTCFNRSGYIRPILA